MHCYILSVEQVWQSPTFFDAPDPSVAISQGPYDGVLGFSQGAVCPHSRLLFRASRCIPFLCMLGAWPASPSPVPWQMMAALLLAVLNSDCGTDAIDFPVTRLLLLLK